MIPFPEIHDCFETRYIGENLKLLPINSLSFDELYAHYHETGFLYPSKLEKMSPHFDLIKQNWERCWAGGRDLMWTLTYWEERLNKMGTVTVWKTTGNSWQSQHLTSQKYAVGILYLLLCAQDEGMLMNYGSGQNWYSPTNGFAMKIYGRMDRVLGADCAGTFLLNYLQLDPGLIKHSSTSFKTTRCTEKNTLAIRHMAELCRGSTYCKAEELDSWDVELSILDGQYQRHGLSRKRYVWMAIEKASLEPKGMIIAYRGPFGLNFSFLENRCDLMVDPSLSQDHRTDVCRVLVGKASQAYFGLTSSPEYPISHLVMMADDPCTAALIDLGAVKTRQYYQGIWLTPGFKKWKKYMERIFSPVIKRYEKKCAITS